MGRKKGRANTEGSVFEYPQGSGIWWAQLPPDEQGRRPKRRASSQREALEKLRELQRDRGRGLNLTTKQPTVAQFLDTWLAEVVQRSVKATTHASYSMVVRIYIKPYIGAQRLDRLTTPHVQSMINKLLDSRADTVVRNVYARLRAALDVAVQWKYVSYNVASPVKLPKMKRSEPHPLTIEQARSLLKAVEDHRLAALFHVALILGLRLGELLGLRWTDLDWDAATLKITQQIQTIGGTTFITSPKSETSKRVLPIPLALLGRLHDHWRNQQEERALLDTDWKEHGLIFPSERGTPKIPRNFERDFYRFRAAAGLSNEINFHLLRHSAATWLDEMGVGEAVIAAILGHSSGSVTRRYLHPRLAAMREVIEQLEQHLLGCQDEAVMNGS